MTDDPHGQSILDAEMLDALLVELKPIAPPADRAASLRERILTAARAAAGDTDKARASAGDTDKITVPPDAGEWVAIAPKVSIKMLHATPESRAFLLRLKPGGRLAPHDHPGDEECMVLEGEVYLAGVHATAGTFHLAPKGSHHGEIRSETGALLYLRIASGEIVHR